MERVSHAALDEDMRAVLRNNPPDVAYPTFSRRFFEEAIRQFQRDSSLQNIVMTDPDARNLAFRHFFSRALREVRETPSG